MKKFKVIVLIVLIFVIALIVGAVIFLKTFDLNKYLPQITSQASKVLGRPLTIGRLDLALSLKGITLDVGPLTIADDPKFSQEPFLAMSGAHLGLEVMPLIFQREIHITAVVLQSPRLKIIRSKEGEFNAQTIGHAPPTAGPGQSATGNNGQVSAAKAPAKPNAVLPAVLPVLSAKSIKVDHASVSFVDLTKQMPLNIQVEDIGVSVDNFSLMKPFRFFLDARAYSAAPDIHAEGEVEFNVMKLGVTASGLVVKADLARLDLEQVKSVTPLLAQMPTPQQLAGMLEVRIPHVEAGVLGLSGLLANMTLSNGVIKFKELLGPVTDIKFKAEVDERDAYLDNFSLKIGSGVVDGKADVKDYAQKRAFHAQASITDVNVDELMDQKALPVELKGKISGQFKVWGQGFSPKEVYENLKGEGELAMAKGVIERLNILKMALGNTLSVIPGLAEQVDALLTGALKKKLGGESTILEKAQAKFSVENSTLFINDALVQTKAFEATAKGFVDYRLKTDIQTMLRLTPDVSASVAGDVKELGYLMDHDQRIAIGASVRGVMPNLKYTPTVDLKKVTQNVIVEEGAKQLQKVIEKNPAVGSILNAVFGGGGKADEQGDTNAQETDANAQQPSPSQDSGDKTKKMINKLFNSILK